MLESALEKERKEHGALLPAKKVQAYYEALEQKDAQIYCKRAKVYYCVFSFLYMCSKVLLCACRRNYSCIIVA